MSTYTNTKVNEKNLTKVTALSMLNEGDWVTYYCPYRNKTLEGEYLGTPHQAKAGVIVCDIWELGVCDIVDITDSDVFILCSKHKIIPASKCECGSKYTSNPNFHLSYCPKKAIAIVA